MAIIHHATVKRAARLGVEIVHIPGETSKFLAIRSEDRAESTVYDSAPALLNAIESGEATFETPKLRGLASGVMAMVYHIRYTNNGGGCGDNLDQSLRALLVSDTGTNLDLLRQVADANGIWTERWASLNPGMQRMNMANRMRAVLRNNAEATINLDGQVGRWGVKYEPSNKALRAQRRAA